MQNNDIVTNLSDIIYDIFSSSKPSLLYDPNDSRYYYPELPSGFSTNTIYRTFIIFCKNKTLNLNKDLLEACGLSNTYDNPDDSIDDKIELMKKDGIMFIILLAKLKDVVNILMMVVVVYSL